MRPVEMASLRLRSVGELRGALALLTRLPVTVSARPTGGAAAFGLVGALVGALGGVAILLVADPAPLAAAALSLGLMVLVTGALHLDGLADTADALAAIGPGAAEPARTDPRVGAAGAAAIGLVLLLDAGWLLALIDRAGVVSAALACVAAGAVSRAIVVTLVAALPPGRKGASGEWFSKQSGFTSAAVASGSAATVVLLTSAVAAAPALILGSLGGSAIALLGALSLVHVRGGIDGDLLGAVVEVTFACVLGAMVLLAP